MDEGMFLKEIPLFSALTRSMDWHSARQKVLARNIANSDTPGYKGRDLEPLKFHDLVSRPDGGMRLAKTSGGHIAPRGEADDSYRRMKQDVQESTPSANNVVLEDEILKVNDSRMAYDMAASLYRKHVQMLKMAIGGRGGG
jgi:flagellar basal-body rod protein FlgB